MLAIHRLIITLTLATFGLSYAQTLLSCDSLADNIQAISDEDNIKTHITQRLENAVKLAMPLEKLATDCEGELVGNDSKSNSDKSRSCLSFQLASNRFEYARIQLNLALAALDWNELGKVLEDWAIRKDELKFLDATHDRIKTLEESLN